MASHDAFIFRAGSPNGLFAPLPCLPGAARAVLCAMSRAWLIGAGPGDVELMTLKATRALAEADVVLVDDLVNPEVLQFARDDALVVYVGKRGGQPSASQANIVSMMLDHLRAGRSVARLKGGDPFVFGRGGEEQQALQGTGIHVEIVNGITAASPRRPRSAFPSRTAIMHRV